MIGQKLPNILQNHLCVCVCVCVCVYKMCLMSGYEEDKKGYEKAKGSEKAGELSF